MILVHSVYICVDWEEGEKLRRDFLIAFPPTEQQTPQTLRKYLLVVLFEAGGVLFWVFVLFF